MKEPFAYPFQCNCHWRPGITQREKDHVEELCRREESGDLTYRTKTQ
jgi:hypothetical protein